MTNRICYDCKTEDPSVPESGWIICSYCKELSSLRVARIPTVRQKLALQEQKRVFVLVPIWHGLRDGLERIFFVDWG